MTEMGVTLTKGVQEGALYSTWRNLGRVLEGGAGTFQVDKEAKDEGGHFRQQ